jgi:DNA-binding transcriptional LysR family regulator
MSLIKPEESRKLKQIKLSTKIEIVEKKIPTGEEIIKAHNLHTTIEFEISDWEILKKFVKADIGVAIISNIILEGEEEGDLLGRILTNYFPEMTYGILIKKGKKLEGLLKNFVDLLTTEKLLQAQTRYKSNF